MVLGGSLHWIFQHQIYRNNTTNAISNIHSVEAKFASIYNYIERLETKEDSVLGYHCSAFLSSYDSPLDAIKESLLRADDKTQWINSFVSELCCSYSLMCEHYCPVKASKSVFEIVET